MMRNRFTEIVLVIAISIGIVLAAFSTENSNTKVESSGNLATGHAFTTGLDNAQPEVIVSGLGFTALVDGKRYVYIFTKANEWYESGDDLNWEKRVDMGTTVWSGLIYLKSYDAVIYFKDKEIKDVMEFAKNWK
jgi:hypothetical protein